jgi:hypothetical protein
MVGAPKAGVLSLGSPSFSMLVLKTNELEKYLVVARCSEMWLRMHGVPRNFPHSEITAKVLRSASTSIRTICQHGVLQFVLLLRCRAASTERAATVVRDLRGHKQFLQPFRKLTDTACLELQLVASAHQAEMDFSCRGHLREQSPGQVLPPHAQGPTATDVRPASGRS